MPAWKWQNWKCRCWKRGVLWGRSLVGARTSSWERADSYSQKWRKSRIAPFSISKSLLCSLTTYIILSSAECEWDYPAFSKWLATFNYAVFRMRQSYIYWQLLWNNWHVFCQSNVPHRNWIAWQYSQCHAQLYRQKLLYKNKTKKGTWCHT